MFIRIINGVAGSSFSYFPGDICEWPDEEAERMIERGIAEPLRDRESASILAGSTPFGKIRVHKPRNEPPEVSNVRLVQGALVTR